MKLSIALILASAVYSLPIDETSSKVAIVGGFTNLIGYLSGCQQLFSKPSLPSAEQTKKNYDALNVSLANFFALTDPNGDYGQNFVTFLTSVEPLITPYTKVMNPAEIKVCLKETSADEATQATISSILTEVVAKNYATVAKLIVSMKTANTDYTKYAKIEHNYATGSLIALQSFNYVCPACVKQDDAAVSGVLKDKFIVAALDTTPGFFQDVVNIFQESGTTGHTLEMTSKCSTCIYNTFGTKSTDAFLGLMSLQLSINKGNYQEAAAIAITIINASVDAAELALQKRSLRRRSALGEELMHIDAGKY